MLEISLMLDTIMRFGINVVAMLILIFGLYYRRYRDKELVIAASLFNIFAFGVLTILSSVEFSLAAGFGLFAILALFTLRSEPLEKIEITYFFGSIAIAVICSVHGTSLEVTCVVIGIVLLGAYVLDHPRILRSAHGIKIKITLDKIDPNVLSNPEEMRTYLSRRLGVEVIFHKVGSVNYVNDMVSITAFYRNKPTQ
ncbi:conserved membrane hypothetical protein [Candidatus Nitrotoga sp. BS]|uniref:DUF4956 domain-containing protein n=1 Tax=Candidatus Nitrotoga sp. BS TaxID=2890408 RepID=UPI001EF3667C|nr:DUF4956 domain-containing protein [Candidatus Nitrotoga sp. BS]CAH1202060.1 conserved membrane hypothetical protein [Candidatus Nitrotoga sp. BS]